MNFLSLLTIFLIVFEATFSDAFIVGRPRPSTYRKSKSQLALDIPLIPSIIGSTLLVFGLFNIENKIDLTDKGLAEARLKKRQERRAKGLIGENTSSEGDKDPFRYRWFEDGDDEDDLQIIQGGGKKGGCG